MQSIIDGDISTVLTAPIGTSVSITCSAAVYVDSFQLAAGLDSSGNDPTTWILEGGHYMGSALHWSIIHHQQDPKVISGLQHGGEACESVCGGSGPCLWCGDGSCCMQGLYEGNAHPLLNACYLLS